MRSVAAPQGIPEKKKILRYSLKLIDRGRDFSYNIAEYRKKGGLRPDFIKPTGKQRTSNSSENAGYYITH